MKRIFLFFCAAVVPIAFADYQLFCQSDFGSVVLYDPAKKQFFTGNVNEKERNYIFTLSNSVDDVLGSINDLHLQTEYFCAKVGSSGVFNCQDEVVGSQNVLINVDLKRFQMVVNGTYLIGKGLSENDQREVISWSYAGTCTEI